MKKFLITALLTLMCTTVFAADQIGSVNKALGRVTVFDGVSPRGTVVTDSPIPIYQDFIVTTGLNSSAVILMNSGDRIALTANSTITFKDTGRYNPGKGKVVFSIKKRGTAAGLTIGLKTAVIGVKGTEFLIDTDNDDASKVYLKNGEIAVDAISGEFIKHNAIEMDEYTVFVKKITGEYEKYLEDLKKEYTEYIKTFTMEAGQAVVIDGNDVSDIKYSNNIDEYFDLLNQ